MSKVQISPYINFQGRAREAMEFYHEVLGGTLDLQTGSAAGGAGPAGPADRIMYARLEADGARIVGSDGNPNFPPQVGDNLALALAGTDSTRMAAIVTALAAGGKLKMPLSPQPWGGQVAWLTDRFGINWMVSVDPA